MSLHCLLKWDRQPRLSPESIPSFRVVMSGTGKGRRWSPKTNVSWLKVYDPVVSMIPLSAFVGSYSHGKRDSCMWYLLHLELSVTVQIIKKKSWCLLLQFFTLIKRSIKTRRMWIKFILKKEKTEQSPGMKLSRNKLHFWAILTPEETWERAPRSETTKKSQFQHTLFGRAKCNWFRRKKKKKKKLLRSTITNNKVENSPFFDMLAS